MSVTSPWLLMTIEKSIVPSPSDPTMVTLPLQLPVKVDDDNGPLGLLSRQPVKHAAEIHNAKTDHTIFTTDSPSKRFQCPS